MKAYEASKGHKFTLEEWRSPQWEDIKKVKEANETGVDTAKLKEIGLKIT